MRIATVQKAINAAGINLELVRGQGYFYFVGPGTENLHTASVMVYRLSDQTIEQWVADAQGFFNEIKEYE